MRVDKATVLLGPALGVFLILSACAPPPPTPTAASAKPGATGSAPAKQAAGDAAKGKDLFGQTCIACHGPDAKGVPGLGKDLTTSTFVKGQTNAQLVDFIKKGRPADDPANTAKVAMPPNGGNPALTDIQIGDIVAFMRTINK